MLDNLTGTLTNILTDFCNAHLTSTKCSKTSNPSFFNNRHCFDQFYSSSGHSVIAVKSNWHCRRLKGGDIEGGTGSCWRGASTAPPNKSGTALGRFYTYSKARVSSDDKHPRFTITIAVHTVDVNTLECVNYCFFNSRQWPAKSSWHKGALCMCMSSPNIISEVLTDILMYMWFMSEECWVKCSPPMRITFIKTSCSDVVQ